MRPHFNCFPPPPPLPPFLKIFHSFVFFCHLFYTCALYMGSSRPSLCWNCELIPFRSPFSLAARWYGQSSQVRKHEIMKKIRSFSLCVLKRNKRSPQSHSQSPRSPLVLLLIFSVIAARNWTVNSAPACTWRHDSLQLIRYIRQYQCWVQNYIKSSPFSCFLHSRV